MSQVNIYHVNVHVLEQISEIEIVDERSDFQCIRQERQKRRKKCLKVFRHNIFVGQHSLHISNY